MIHFFASRFSSSAPGAVASLLFLMSSSPFRAPFCVTNWSHSPHTRPAPAASIAGRPAGSLPSPHALWCRHGLRLIHFFEAGPRRLAPRTRRSAGDGAPERQGKTARQSQSFSGAIGQLTGRRQRATTRSHRRQSSHSARHAGTSLPACPTTAPPPQPSRIGSSPRRTAQTRLPKLPQLPARTARMNAPFASV